MRTYYDIGLNLFTRSFPDPERIIADAEAAGICCILTGSEARENELVNEFVKPMMFTARRVSIPMLLMVLRTRIWNGLRKLFFPIRRSWRWGNADWIMTECIRRRKTSFIISKS